MAVKTDSLETQTDTSHKQLQVADDAYSRKLDLTLADGSIKTVYLGTASVSAASHIRLAGQSQVYLGHGLATIDLSADPTAWIETTYMNLAQTDILTVTLQNAAGKFVFVHDSQNNWTLQDLAASEKLNPDAIPSLLAHLSNLQMTEPLGRIPKPEYGMDKPAAILTIDSKAGTSIKTTLLTVGQKQADNSYVIISSDSPYYVGTAQLYVNDFAVKTRNDFLALPPTPTPAPVLVPTVAPTASVELTATATITPTK